jgi:hypothetical protein
VTEQSDPPRPPDPALPPDPARPADPPNPTAPADLDAWTAHLAAELGVDPGVADIAVILDVARDAAHAVARPAAPLTAFLLGYAAARQGAGGAAEVRAVAARAAEVIAAWQA